MADREDTTRGKTGPAERDALGELRRGDPAPDDAPTAPLTPGQKLLREFEAQQQLGRRRRRRRIALVAAGAAALCLVVAVIVATQPAEPPASAPSVAPSTLAGPEPAPLERREHNAEVVFRRAERAASLGQWVTVTRELDLLKSEYATTQFYATHSVAIAKLRAEAERELQSEVTTVGPVAEPTPPELPPALRVPAQPAALPGEWASLFDGRSLNGWHGMRHVDPRTLAAMGAEERARLRENSMPAVHRHWRVENGELVNDGQGVYLTTDRDYGDVELLVDFKLAANADSGIYLRATPQVQIWDRPEEGSGGLWNNRRGAPGKDPLAVADNPVGHWNRFRILQIGARTSVWLNATPVVERAIMANYFDRALPLCSRGPIQLQTYSGEIRWRNIRLREIPPEEANRILRTYDGDGFTPIFNGKDLTGWAGPVQSYEVNDGALVCKQDEEGTLYTKEEYGDFVVHFEFKLPPGGRNGLAIRYPGRGEAAYDGMCELQVLDNTHPVWQGRDPRQYHGSAYGLAAAHRGYLRPVGEWNFQKVTVQGSTIQVELNGSIILDCDLARVTEFMDNRPHPGRGRARGHFGFVGHAHPVAFRHIEIKPLAPRRQGLDRGRPLRPRPWL